VAQPTAQEQELLELINRMRIDPSKELDYLLASADKDPEIRQALDYFKVNISVLKQQWSGLKTVAPLAWSDGLAVAALAHTNTMIANDTQAHHVVVNGQAKEEDLAGRLKNIGKYDFTFGRENVYAFANSVFYAHAGFAIDWGEGAGSKDGIQDPAGHRVTMMAEDVREVGISVVAENDPNTKVGPLVITQDFGSRDALTGKGYLLGVAFDDKNKDGFYQAGEGLNDVKVNITSIDGRNVKKTINTQAAGGYQELLDPGNYQVDFVRNDLVFASKIAKIDSAMTQNVKLDFVLPVAPLSDPLNAVPQAILGYSSKSDGVEGQFLDFLADASNQNAPLQDREVSIQISDLSSEAQYNNYVGLYAIMDAKGTVKDPLDGKTYTPGQSGYVEAALRSSMSDRDGMSFDKQGVAAPKLLKGGQMYAPFIIADGNMDSVLNNGGVNKPHVYFNYLEANPDKVDHIISLGANKFAFEDLYGGGDKDYNDMIFQVDAAVKTA
jgi:hypothetical protein